jgi:hypothetical protein
MQRKTKLRPGGLYCGASAGCARYAPGYDIWQHVSAGQGHTQQPSPEPRAQVRILRGAQRRGINSNALTILDCTGARPVTCGNVELSQI